MNSIPGTTAAMLSQPTVTRDFAKQAESKSEIEAVASEFEGVFLSMVMKEMRQTLSEGGFFEGESSDSFGGMFDMFVGEHLAKSQPLGISQLLLQQYEKNAPQEEGQRNVS